MLYFGQDYIESYRSYTTKKACGKAELLLNLTFNDAA